MSNTHYFTFGQNHECNHPLMTSRIADHWVEVRLPEGQTGHRGHFMRHFTRKYCPHELQFAFEYEGVGGGPGEITIEAYPAGCLCVIGPDGQIEQDSQ